MFLKSALVVAALIVAELAVYVAVVGRFNPLLVTLICIGLSVVGMQFLLKTAPGLVARTLSEVVEGIDDRVNEHLGVSVAEDQLGVGRRPGRVNEATVADRAVKIIAAGLLAFPGMLTGLVGLLLFVGPVRGLVASSLGSRLVSLLPAGALGGHSSVRHGVHADVVDVTSTVKDPAPSSTSAHGARTPELSSTDT